MRSLRYMFEAGTASSLRASDCHDLVSKILSFFINVQKVLPFVKPVYLTTSLHTYSFLLKGVFILIVLVSLVLRGYSLGLVYNKNGPLLCALFACSNKLKQCGGELRCSQSLLRR